MKDARVSSNPQVMMGKPVVAGMRITVELILEKLASGESMEKLLTRTLVRNWFWPLSILLRSGLLTEYTRRSCYIWRVP